MPTPKDPTRPADDEARALARTLLREATSAVLAVCEPGTGLPLVSRIGFGLGPGGGGLSLVSDLSQHTAALRAAPDAGLMVGEPGPKGDPLTSPRLSLRARAAFVDADDPARPGLRDLWLATHPKAKLYVDFADFHFVRFAVSEAFLNGGFGRAYRLTAEDLFPGGG